MQWPEKLDVIRFQGRGPGRHVTASGTVGILNRSIIANVAVVLAVGGRRHGVEMLGDALNAPMHEHAGADSWLVMLALTLNVCNL